PVKPSTPDALRALRDDGVRVVMLTGDSRTTAAAVARRLGIDEVHAEVLPQEKGEVVRRLQAAGRVVAMAGDGVNDAPALAASEVEMAGGRRKLRPRARRAPKPVPLALAPVDLLAGLAPGVELHADDLPPGIDEESAARTPLPATLTVAEAGRLIRSGEGTIR